jgi:hypothetical protein
MAFIFVQVSKCEASCSVTELKSNRLERQRQQWRATGQQQFNQFLCLLFVCTRRYLQGAAHNVQADRHDEDAADSKQPKLAAGEAVQLTPQALAVQLICRCDEIPDEGVEVLVLRGLLTASTSLTFTLHGQALLLAVRTCYNIHLMSRSEVNQTTAKAALTQMLNVVFQRMEAGSVKIAVSSAAGSGWLHSVAVSSRCCCRLMQLLHCRTSKMAAVAVLYWASLQPALSTLKLNLFV